nr:hypothetical protein [Tanacetum cinerariifolium]
MLLLVVQNRLSNLSGDDVSDFTIALRMFTRSLVIQKRVEDLQLGVKSYQKKINVNKPETTKSRIRKRDPYTPYQDPQDSFMSTKIGETERFNTIAGNPVKDILLKLNLPDHRNQVVQNAVQNLGVQNVKNQNGLIVVLEITNQYSNGNGNVAAAQAEGNGIGNNGNQIRCYNCRGLGHLSRNYTVRPRRGDAAYLQI